MPLLPRAFPSKQASPVPCLLLRSPPAMSAMNESQQVGAPVVDVAEHGDPGQVRHASVVELPPLDATGKSQWERRAAVFACGAGLFSDGYLNGIIGYVNTILATLYGDDYTNSPAQSNVASIAFAGQVVGILIFGWTSDHWSRKWSLFVSTIILFIFAALGAGAYGGGSDFSLFAALTAYRFLLGVGIGGEYPAGSVASAENTGELPSGVRNRWFVWFSNVAIDVAFVVASIVATIVYAACGENHLRAAWRIMLGLGVIPPLSLIWMRYKLDEPEAFKRGTMAKTKTPWSLVFKLYGWRLLAVSVIWFIYDFSSYAFGLYFTIIGANLAGSNSTNITIVAAWSILLNFLYIPGAVLGSFVTDWIGPRKALAYGVWAQAVVGFIMAGVYKYLAVPQNIGGFVVVYGIFLSLGELGPGDNIGLICSKTSATGIRGQYYAVAAASGKIGAFIGTYIFPYLAKAGGNGTESAQYPFYLASGLAIISGLIAFFGLPEIGQDILDVEETRFRAYLAEHNYDISKLGLTPSDLSLASEKGEVQFESQRVSKME